MRSPFPGMDPYLEHPALWPDVHNSLLAAMRDVIAPLVAPRYYVRLERRAYLLTPDDLVFIGRPDIAVSSGPAVVAEPPPVYGEAVSRGADGPIWVELPIVDEVGENFIEIRAVVTGKLITVLELLSPANKLHEKGREQYEDKRATILSSRTNLIEVDLLRAGDPMPMRDKLVRSDYRILISRSWQRPRAQLYSFSLRQPIPAFSIPLLRGEDEPQVDLNTILHSLYTRARFDLELDYSQPPVPPLNEQDSAWARELIGSTKDKE